MRIKKVYVLFLVTMAFSLTAIPAAAAGMSPELSDYMARLALGRLYVPYYTVTAEPQAEAPQPSAPAPPAVQKPTVTPPTEESAEDVAPPEGAIAVQALNLCRYEADEAPRLIMMNETDYKADIEALAKSTVSQGKGAVLILHTHGTESYLPHGRDYYKQGESFRSNNTEENVVAVGAVFAEVLRSAGITVYHDTTMYDATNFNDAYAASRAGAKQWLAQHKDIKYIIDIHRDAITKDGASCKTLCQTEQEPTAQVMLVIGTNEAGANHAGWRNNLALAAKYQVQLNKYPTLARPVYLRSASFNQQLSAGSMLLEIGSAANTLTEAKNAATLAAQSFVRLYNQ